MVASASDCRFRILACLLIGFIVGPALAKDPGDPQTIKELRELLDKENFDDEESDDSKKTYNTKIETPLIGEYTTFAGLSSVKVEGVGLVVGLRGTGGNPAPSPLRTALLEDLKHRNVPKPNEILRSPDTALVYLRAMLPPLLEKGDTVDVQVWIPDSAEATSLEGGWLMEAYLAEQAFIPGVGTKTGHRFARAKGPILTAAIGEYKKGNLALVKRGVVIGGGSVTKERELSVYLRNDFMSIRNAQRVAHAISSRFHDYNKHGIQQPMAEAKNDQKIKLLVHPKYKNNFPRYLQVIRHIAFKEKDLARRLRIDRLREELLIPKKSEQAALQLEGIGSQAIPTLKAGLSSPMIECRFHAASALAYLGEADGVSALEEVVRTEPAFRVFALAALSVIEDADANVALRRLMSEPGMETRYGSFRSLWVLDKNDPFIRGDLIKVLDDKTGYMLHEVDTQNEPLVHLTTRTRPEIVLFGKDQKLSAPLFLTAGKNLMVTAQAGAETASIHKFTPNQPDESREVSLNVADVIRGVSELDATYPDIVQMLTEASMQHNLPGRFTHDALPEAGRMYDRPQMVNGKPAQGSRKTRIGRDHMVPNLFSKEVDPEEKANRQEEMLDNAETVMKSVPPEETGKEAAQEVSTGRSDNKRPGPSSESKMRKSFFSNLPRLRFPRPTKGNTEPALKESSSPPKTDENEPPEQSEPR